MFFFVLGEFDQGNCTSSTVVVEPTIKVKLQEQMV
jgi:hypothetical protein